MRLRIVCVGNTVFSDGKLRCCLAWATDVAIFQPRKDKPLRVEMQSIKVWCLGGEDSHLRLSYCVKLIEAGIEVTAVGTGDPEPFEQRGVPYLGYHLDRFFDLAGNWRSFTDLSALIKRHRPDIVHGFDTKPSLLAPLAVRRAGIGRAVRTINGMGALFSPNASAVKLLRPAYRALQRHVRSKTALTVFQNRKDFAYFAAHGMVDQSRSRVIPGSGIDPEDFARRMPDAAGQDRRRKALGLEGKTVITTVTRLTRQKGIVTLLAAAKALTARFDDLAFLLVGPKDTEGPLAIGDSELSPHRDYVHAIGPRDDVPAILAISDLFVFPTEYREGVPRVLLEASAAGLPIVASDMPGCDEVVRHEHNGLLTPPGDPERLAASIATLLRDDQRRKEMGANGRAMLAGRLTLDCIVADYLDAYEEVMNGAAETRH